MASQYDIPGQGRFMNTYVPIPFQEMAGALQNRQRQYEIGAAQKANTFSALKDIKLAAPDEKDYQQKMAVLDKQLQDLMSRQPDMGSLEFKTELNNIQSQQGRDDWWRQAQKNEPIYAQLLKDYQEAVADNKPWNYVPLKAELENFQEYGTAGIGELYPTIASKPGDLVKEADALGKGFRVEGSIWGRNDETGGLYVKKGREEVAFQEVAYLYGYNVNKETGEPELVNPNIGLMSGEGGRDMMRQAEMIASLSEDRKPEEVFMDLYEAATLPLVYKYSGVKTTDTQQLTSLGLKDIERERFSIDYYIANVGAPVTDDGFASSKSGKLFGLWSIVNKALLMNPATALVGVAGEMQRKWLISGAEDYMEQGLTLKQASDSIDAQTETLADEFMRVGNPAASFVTKQLGTMKRVGLEVSYSNFAPIKPTEHYISYANRVLSTSSEYSSKDWNALDRTEKNKLHKQLNKDFDKFSERGINVSARAIDSKTKAEVSSILIGQADDQGVVTGERAVANGMVSQWLVIDPRNPETQATFNEFVKNKDKIDYIGPASYDNPYGPGMHVININGKPFFVQAPKVNAENHPLEGRDIINEMLPYTLNTFKHHISGIGDWISTGGYKFRTVTDKFDKNGNPSKVHLEYVIDDGMPSRESITGSEKSKSFETGEVQNVFNSLFDLDKSSQEFKFKGLASDNYKKLFGE